MIKLRLRTAKATLFRAAPIMGSHKGKEILFYKRGHSVCHGILEETGEEVYIFNTELFGLKLKARSKKDVPNHEG
jgi:hypothetical protein